MKLDLAKYVEMGSGQAAPLSHAVTKCRMVQICPVELQGGSFSSVEDISFSREGCVVPSLYLQLVLYSHHRYISNILEDLCMLMMKFD